METRNFRNSFIRTLAVLMAFAFAAAGMTAARAEQTEGVREVRNVIYTMPIPAECTEKGSGEVPVQGGVIQWIRWENEAGNEVVYSDVTSYKKVFSVNADQIKALYDSQTETVDGILWQEDLTLDGRYAARALATANLKTGEDGKEYAEIRVRLFYFLGSNILNLYYESREAAEAMKDETRMPKAEEWLPVLQQVHYALPENREGLPDWLVTLNSFVCTLSTKNDQLAVAAGKTLQIQAQQQEYDRIRAMDSKAARLNWALADAEVWAQEGKLAKVDSSVATISANGLLKAGKVDDVTVVIVMAYNQASDYIASASYLIVPQQKSLTIDETKITLYAGESAPVTLTAAADPEQSMLFSTAYSNISWSTNNAEVLEVTDLKNGKAEVKALAPGKATVTVSDSVSGRSAKAAVNVLSPVTGVTISGPDTVQPGRSVLFKAALTPERPSNRKMTWSLEKGGEYASITESGRLDIRKDAPEGTEIIIKCQAEGSSQERVDRKTVTVQP
ncbi:MAG: hypothetical protein IKO25_11700 [Clostridia bacterium]|nr:hypothetical protein [Clostridia bacterium]